MTDSGESGVRRKQAARSRARGKAGQRAVEAALEAANLVVQLVDTENDIGRDAFVEMVDGTDVTGGVVCIQVKSGPSYFHDDRWVIPGRPEDFLLWQESTVPFMGIAHDPATGALRWVDLSYAARISDPYVSPRAKGPFGLDAVPIPEANRLDLDPTEFVASAHAAVGRIAGIPARALLSDDAGIVEVGVADAFAHARQDVTALLLVGALFRRLPKGARGLALTVLAMATRHPDIGWTRGNWIPDGIKREFEARCRWSRDDVEAILEMIDERGIERGSVGQNVFHVLELDRSLGDRLFEVASDTKRASGARFWAAAILLYQAEYDAPLLLARMRRRAPDLAGLDGFSELASVIQEHGCVDLF